MEKLSFTLKGREFTNFTSTDIQKLVTSNEITQAEASQVVFNAQLQRQQNTINRCCEKELSALTAQYPKTEIATFDKQESEARAYHLDNASETPLIDAMAAARGIDKTELVSRIILKADAFATASGEIIGKRHKLEDLLDAMTPETHSINDIQAITWDNAE